MKKRVVFIILPIILILALLASPALAKNTKPAEGLLWEAIASLNQTLEALQTQIDEIQDYLDELGIPQPPGSETLYSNEVVHLPTPPGGVGETTVVLPMELKAGDRLEAALEITDESSGEVACSLGTLYPNLMLGADQVTEAGDILGGYGGSSEWLFTDARRVMQFNQIIPSDGTYFIVIRSDGANEHDVLASATRYPGYQRAKSPAELLVQNVATRLEDLPPGWCLYYVESGPSDDQPFSIDYKAEVWLSFNDEKPWNSPRRSVTNFIRLHWEEQAAMYYFYPWEGSTAINMTGVDEAYLQVQFDDNCAFGAGVLFRKGLYVASVMSSNQDLRDLCIEEGPEVDAEVAFVMDLAAKVASRIP